MHLASHILTAITLSLLGTGLTSHALPINANALGSKLESLTHPLTNLARLNFDSLKLIGREIHNADYGTAGKPQNASSVANSGSSAPASNPSSSPGSPKAASAKDKQRRGKMRLVHMTHTSGEERNPNQVTDDDQGHKHIHGREATDYPSVFSRDISDNVTSDYQDFNSKDNSTPSPSSMTFVGRKYSAVKPDSSVRSNENNAYGYYGYYRIRHVRKPKYNSFLRFGNEDDLFGQGTFSYRELSSYNTHATRHLSPTEEGLWAKTKETHGVDGVDVSGGGGTRDIRHFDPREVDRMTAIYTLSHGVPVDNSSFSR